MTSPVRDAEEERGTGSASRSIHPQRSERAELENPLRKRRRIALACSNCRHRKSRCDGGRPKCSLCVELGCNCLYEQAGITTSLTIGRTYISRLERRLEDIEQSLGQLQQAQQTTNSTRAETIQSGNGASTDNQGAASREDSVESQAPSHFIYSMNDEMRETDIVEDSIDGMGAMKFTDEEDCGYFGPSSNIAFLRHISFAVTQTSGRSQGILSPPSLPRVVARWMSVSRPHHVHDDINERGSSRSHGSVNIYALPSEARTWCLIKEYFQKTGQLLPFVHEASFCETYVQTKRNNFTRARRTWLGLLNIILAMATTLSVEGYVSSEKRIEESDIYYQRANSLCDRESRQNISLELVQYLLILGQYLQGTQKSVQAWMVHGLAITTAFQLGLHSPSMNQDFSPLECEIRKRVWFGCILLDRTLSMTFGRPSIIPDSYVKLDLPITNMQILGRMIQSEPSPQMDAMCYTATMLYRVMYHIIDTCYGQNLGLDHFPPDAEIISLVLKGQRQLDEWKSQLPLLNMHVYNALLSYQDLEKMNENDLIIERFNIVLSLRYHNLCILLHRPILEKFLDAYGRYHNSSDADDAESNLLQQVGLSSIDTCVNSAMIIISIVHTVVLSNGWRRDLLGAWNYSLFYTFNAALFIFGAVLVFQEERKPMKNPSTRWGFIEKSPIYLNTAVEALRNLDVGNRVVERCVNYLSQLSLTLLNASPTYCIGPVSALPTINSASHANETQTGTSLHQNQLSAWILNQNLTPRDLPMELDLSEFMLDTDLDIFARHFDWNH